MIKLQKDYRQAPVDAPLYLIDGSGFIFRAFHALPPMVNPIGVPINAVFGFANMLLKLLRQTHARNIAVIFDAKRETFRNKIYADYKANRSETPPELIPQFALIKEVTAHFGFIPIELEGYEADDLIATYATQAAAQNREVVIVSSDKDLMQLIEPKVSMYDAMKNKEIRAAEVEEKFGLGPEKVIDIQALAGDAADNVPGVPGIGVKTAAALLKQYGTLEVLLERAGEIKQTKRRENLIEFADLARLSKQLVTLKRDVPLSQPLEDLLTSITPKASLKDFLRVHQLKSLLAKIENGALDHLKEEGQVEKNIVVQPKQAFECIRTKVQLEDWIKLLSASHIIAFDTETMGLDAHETGLVGLSFAVSESKACYIPLQHKLLSGEADQGDLFAETPSERVSETYKEAPDQLDLSKTLQALKPILEDPSILKIAHNVKFDMQVIAQHAIQLSPFADTMLMSYVLDGQKHLHSMDALAKLYFDYDTKHFEDLVGKGKGKKTFDQVPIDEASFYAAEDAAITFRLHSLLKQRLIEEKFVALYDLLDCPLVSVIARMESCGVLVDRLHLKSLSALFEAEMARIEKIIFKHAGHEFNIASPKQLGIILFEEMAIGGGKKGKSGAYKTHTGILEPLAENGNELVTSILEWRHFAKLKSTYSDTLPNAISQKTGRVHTHFMMTGTNTGRLSSNQPNLQNIPIRTSFGKEIRKAFIAPRGSKIVSIDYSQIELRIIAAIANVEALKNAFAKGQDIHRLTASKVFAVSYEEVTSTQRRDAKAVNFGIIYGIGPFSLAKQMACSPAEAKAFIDTYFKSFPELKIYMDEAKRFAVEYGYAKTFAGRHCYILDAQSENRGKRSFAERQAINAPIQGTSADIIKRAMIDVDQFLRAYKSKMILQVHDELLFEVPDAEIDNVPDTLKAIIEAANPLSLPLIAEIGIGNNWAEAH